MARKSLIEDIRKDQIIGSAIESLASVGYFKATLDQIAETADVSRGVVSYYFKSKDQLLSSVMKVLLQRQWNFIMTRVNNVDSPSDKLREYISASFDHMIADRTHYEAQIELLVDVEFKRELPIKLYGICINSIEEILTSGIESGEFRAFNIHNMAVLIQSCIDGTMMQWVCNESTVDPEQEKTLALDMVFQFIGK